MSGLYETERDEAMCIRTELDDKITLLKKEGKDLFEMASLDNDYVVLSERNDSFPIKGLTRVSDRIQDMSIHEMVCALGVTESYFREVDDEIAMFIGGS